MTLFTINPTTKVAHGQYNSTNGATADLDVIPTIYIASKENLKDFITRTKLMNFRNEYGADALVVYKWAPTGEEIFAAMPIDIALNGVKGGHNCFGGNHIELDGELIPVHDRVESWEMYNRLSR